MEILQSQDIEAILPHRGLFLLVDEITELVPGIHAAGKLRVSEDAPWAQGLFPPVMPDALIIEALAQCGSIALLSMEEHRDKLCRLTAADTVRFKRKVSAGDTLTLIVELEGLKYGVCQGRAVALVDNLTAVSAALKFSLSEKT